MTVQWTDDQGMFKRRLFVSRTHGIAVLLITGSDGAMVNCRLKLKPRDPSKKLNDRKLASSSERFKSHITDLKITAENSTLTFRNTFANAYPGSIHALEGVARVKAKNGSTIPEGDTLVITGTDQVLIFVDVNVIYDPDRPRIEEMKKSLTNLSTDYDSLLRSHKRIHGEIFNRMRLDRTIS